MSGAIEILHEPSATEPFAVISKPAGLASAPLRSLDEESAFSQCARLFPAVLSVRGKKSVEGGLLHRIDTATSGLLLAAASQEFYDHIIAAQEAGRFVKGYRALCQIDSDNAKKLGGFPPAPRLPQSPKGWQGQNAAALVGLELSSRFRPFGKGGALLSDEYPFQKAHVCGGKRLPQICKRIILAARLAHIRIHKGPGEIMGEERLWGIGFKQLRQQAVRSVPEEKLHERHLRLRRRVVLRRSGVFGGGR